MDLRSKARTLNSPVTDPSKLPKWNYNGSSTGQAPGEDSEVILYPQAVFKDPFRRANNILVMCDAYTPGGEPIPTNKRFNAKKIFSHPDVAAEEPWYGIEQEYTLLQKEVNWPIGWPVGGFPGPQWEFQVGPAVGISSGDQLWVACYILEGDWNGAGARTNYSAKSMRNGGFEVIKKAIEKLGLKHKEHIAACEEGNEHRLTGKHETADINTFL